MFFLSLFLTGAPPRGRCALTFFCWPSSFQRTLANSPRFSTPRSFRLRVQKYYIFLYLQQLFSLFFKLFPFALNVSKINFTFFAIIAAARRFSGGNRGFRRLPGGRIPPFSARFGALLARFWRVFGGNPPAFHGFHAVPRRSGQDSPRDFFRRTPYYI